MATLTGVHIHVITGNDGLDRDSSFYAKLYFPNENDNIADFMLAHTRLNPGDVLNRDLSMHTNTFDMSNINQAIFYLEINAIGHDSFFGNLTVTFTDSDGKQREFGYGEFGIGTYHISHTTRKTVSLHLNLLSV